VFYFINDAINQLCKITIKQERPADGKKIINEPYFSADKYGMPSRHSESAFFSCFYLFLVKGDVNVLIFELFICALTLYQRIKYRQHTIEQLCVGSILGISVASIGYFLTNRYIISNV